jgi:hypothetical protein
LLAQARGFGPGRKTRLKQELVFVVELAVGTQRTAGAGRDETNFSMPTDCLLRWVLNNLCAGAVRSRDVPPVAIADVLR